MLFFVGPPPPSRLMKPFLVLGPIFPGTQFGLAQSPFGLGSEVPGSESIRVFFETPFLPLDPPFGTKESKLHKRREKRRIQSCARPHDTLRMEPQSPGKLQKLKDLEAPSPRKKYPSPTNTLSSPPPRLHFSPGKPPEASEHLEVLKLLNTPHPSNPQEPALNPDPTSKPKAPQCQRSPWTGGFPRKRLAEGPLRKPTGVQGKGCRKRTKRSQVQVHALSSWQGKRAAYAQTGSKHTSSTSQRC